MATTVALLPVLWGYSLPAGTRATRLQEAPPLWWAVDAARQAAPAHVKGLVAVAAQGVVLVLRRPPARAADALADLWRLVASTPPAAAGDTKDASVAARFEELMHALARFYVQRTLVDLDDAAALASGAYRRVLVTEHALLARDTVDDRPPQWTAMTLRLSDARGDPNGAVVKRERHVDVAQVLVPLAGAPELEAELELEELGRRVPLVPGVVKRVPPGVTHTIRLHPAPGTRADPASTFCLLSLYTQAEHPEGLVQATRPADD